VSDPKARIEAARRLHADLRVPLKIDGLVVERQKLERDMERPDFWSNQEHAQKVVQSLKGIRATTDLHASVLKRLDDAPILLELAEGEKDASAFAEVDRELDQVERDLRALKLQALFTHPNDPHSALLKFQAGMGGLDACDWTKMVVRMVTRYAESKGFKVEVDALDPEPEAGFKSARIGVEGRGAFGWMRGLQGTMRLVRISPYDAQSRRQTAFCAIEVLPEAAEEKTVEIKDADCRWETFASGGPGGQHVNKTQSGVRVRHIPTGLMVECTEQRNQGANKKRALKILASKLATLEDEKRAAAAHASYQTKSTMGFGADDRHITVTLQPFTLAKDRRTGWETSDTIHFLDGDLDPTIEAYLHWAASGGKPVAQDGD
jgi:peptide chain release factor 2